MSECLCQRVHRVSYKTMRDPDCPIHKSTPVQADKEFCDDVGRKCDFDKDGVCTVCSFATPDWPPKENNTPLNEDLEERVELRDLVDEAIVRGYNIGISRERGQVDSEGAHEAMEAWLDKLMEKIGE